MVNIVDVFEKYIDVITSKEFVTYEKEFADRVTTSISKKYCSGEKAVVEIIEAVINATNELGASDNMVISTKGVFIHGTKSEVKFNYYGEETNRELGDLIFIGTLIYEGRKVLERMTINQFKKDEKSKSISWKVNEGDTNEEQLYLLSRFPVFESARGHIPKGVKYSLPNYSGCLGSYGLIYKPGDFAFISAIDLASIIGNNTSISIDELYRFGTEQTTPLFIPNLLSRFPELPYYYSRRSDFLTSPLTPIIDLPLTKCYNCAFNVHEFSRKYLTLGIGEHIYSFFGVRNEQAKNLLCGIIENLRQKREKEYKAFADSFFRFRYANNDDVDTLNGTRNLDSDGGGIGIIHVSLNLGE